MSSDNPVDVENDDGSDGMSSNPTNLRLQSLVIESIKRKVNAERNVRQKLEKRLKDQKAAAEKIESQVEHERGINQELLASLTAARAALKSSRKTIAEKEADINNVNKKLSEAVKECATLEKTLKKEDTKHEKKISVLQKRMNAQSKKHKSELKKLKTSLASAAKKTTKDVKLYKEEERKALERIDILETELGAYKVEIEHQSGLIEKLKKQHTGEITQVKKQYKALQKKKKACDVAMAKVRSNHMAATKELVQLQDTVTLLQNTISNEDGSTSELEAKVEKQNDALKREKRTVKELRRKLAIENKAKKKANKAKREALKAKNKLLALNRELEDTKYATEKRLSILEQQQEEGAAVGERETYHLAMDMASEIASYRATELSSEDWEEEEEKVGVGGCKRKADGGIEERASKRSRPMPPPMCNIL